MLDGLKPYPAYKESGVPWLGKVPEHWEVRRGKALFARMDRPPRESDDVITCFRDGAVTLRKNRRVSGFTESLKEIGYQGIRRGDLVIHAMDAFALCANVRETPTPPALPSAAWINPPNNDTIEKEPAVP